MEVDSDSNRQATAGVGDGASVAAAGFVTQWDNAGEHIVRRKVAREHGADDNRPGSLRVTETRYAALTRDDIAALQMIFSLTWADLIDEGKPRPVFWEPFTLKLDFIPRTDIHLPRNYNWAIFTRLYPTYNARASRFFRDWLHEEIQQLKKATFCVLFWMRFSQPDPVKNPGTIDIEFGLTEEDAPTHRERIECFSPATVVQNPLELLYVLPYLRIEGRLTRDNISMSAGK